jgi:DNA/RNA endonuclease YhcR with UshA esterase domain
MSKLLSISLAISLIGIFILIIIATTNQPEKITGKTITNDLVEATGQIVSVKNYDEFSIINLDTNFTVVCFQCQFKPGDNVMVQGTVEDYQSKKQINAETIEKIN